MDDPQDFRFVGQNLAQFLDQANQLLVFVFQLFALQPRQAAQRHFENRVGLNLRQFEHVHEGFAGVFGVGAVADDADDFVDMIDGDAQAFDDMQALFGLVQIEQSAAADDFAAMLEVMAQHAIERQIARLAVDEGQHDRAEGRLHLGMFIQVVDDDLRHFALFQFHDDAHAVAVGLVADKPVIFLSRTRAAISSISRALLSM